MKICHEIEKELMTRRDDAEAAHLMRFFKCAPGQYGEGDRFLGIRVPVTREIVRRYRKEAEIEDAVTLTASPWHEIRLAGFLLLIEIYKRAKGEEKSNVVDKYLSLIERGNNWDLVDLVAPKILGDWLVSNPEELHVLDELAAMSDSLWHQRVAMVANWTLIREGINEPTLRLSRYFLTHRHDLMHKASGWMLREVGNRNLPVLLSFLNRHAHEMPRTMLRYAIEKFDEPMRRKYMSMKGASEQLGLDSCGDFGSCD